MDLDYQVMELAASRQAGQLSTKEMMLALHELVAEHGEEAEAAVETVHKQLMLSAEETEQLLGLTPRPPGTPGRPPSSRPPLRRPEDPDEAKRWGS